MAKLTVLMALLLVALVVVVHTSASSRSQSCKKQIESANLKHCERHVMQRLQQQQENHHASLLRRRNSRQEEEESDEELEKCCNELNEINSQRCKCRALQQIFENQCEQLEGRQQEEDLEQEVQKLPRSCGMRPMPWCDVNPDEQE